VQQFRGGINLVPPEIAETRELRRNWFFAGAIVAVVFFVLLVLTFLNLAQARDLRNKVQRQQVENEQLRQKAASLEYLEVLQTEFETQRTLVQQAWQNEVSWPKVLQEIAAIMPDGVYLTSFTGNAGQVSSSPVQGVSTEGARGAPPQQQQAPLPPSSPSAQRKLLGQVQIQATARTHREVAAWLYRINRGMPSLTGAWVQNASLQEQEIGGGGGTRGITISTVSFSSNAYLTPYAMGWMGRCAERGFDQLVNAPFGVCGHSFYGAQVGPAPGARPSPTRAPTRR
jgi:Tfp pilus assembly protein PilN